MRLLKKFRANAVQDAVSLITPMEASQKLSSGELVLIDVREPNEWAADGSPYGCQRIALQNPHFLEEVLQSTNYDKNAKIAVCCRSGMRGDKAVRLLLDAGFNDVANVEGGMVRWLTEELPVIS